jgi:predicted transcriptional regulator
MIPVMNQRVKQGIHVRALIPAERLPAGASMPETPKNVEFDWLPELPAIVAITEKEAGVCFMQLGGKVDYAGFFGADPVFHRWVKDLFMYYWENGKRAGHN